MLAVGMHYYRPTRMQLDRDYGQRRNDLWNSSLSVMTTDRWSCWRMDLAAAAAGPHDSFGSTMRARWSSGWTGPVLTLRLKDKAPIRERTDASI